MEAQAYNHTLFVGGIPFDTTTNALEDIFGDIGPLKKCFIVRHKGTNKSKGVAFVEYALSEDAERAKRDIKNIGKRKLKIEFAKSRAPFKERKQKFKGENDEPAKEVVPKDEAKKTDFHHNKTNSQPSRRNRLIIRNLSFKIEQKDLQDEFSKFGTVIETTMPLFADGKKKGFAFVGFNSQDNATKAMKALNGTKIKGRPIVVDWSVAKDRYENKGKQVQKKQTSEVPEEVEAKVKKKKINKKSNKVNETASTTHQHDQDETEDMETESGKSPNNARENENDSDRNYDTDDSDDELVNLRSSISKTANSKVKGTGMDVAAKHDDESDGSDDESESEAGGSSESESETLGNSNKDEGNSNKNINKSMDIADSSDSEDENESDSGESNEDVDSDSENESDLEDGDNEDESDMESDMEFYDDDDGEGKMKKKKRHREEKSDVEEGKTLFVRNLPYEATNDDLHGAFSKFGKLMFAVVVIDPYTDRSRGTGFVKFKEKSDAESCLEKIVNPPEEVSIQGRKLNVSLAVDKRQAEKLKVEKKEGQDKKAKDSRNLWLAREGLIRPGSKEAEGLPKADLDKRVQLEAAMRTKLKNPNTFISTTRLCVHNLPSSVTDVQLRKLLLDAVGERTAKIDECRIMRDMARVNNKGQAKSRGYGFVNFTQHVHALKALRALNNNAELFGEKKRPMVEFSIEDRLKLAVKEKRLERIKLKETVLKSENKTGTFTGLRKKKKEKKDENDPTVAKPPENLPKGMKALPSHWGPKVRHKSREEPNKKAKKRKQQQPLKQPQEKKQKIHKPNKKEKSDNFDSLVNKYKQKLSSNISNQNGGSAKQKWFS